MNKPYLYLQRCVSLSSRVSGEETVFVADYTFSVLGGGGGFETGSRTAQAFLELSMNDLKPLNLLSLSPKC